jgi:hypothetical protein
MAMAGHVPYMTCRVGKPERKGNFRCKREYNIKMHREEVTFGSQ